MSIGKQIRLGRLFHHTSSRLCSVAVDHFITYGKSGDVIPKGLQQIRETLRQIVEGQPDAITMHRGIAASAWAPFAGRIPLILQSSLCRLDASLYEQIADPEEAVRLAADGFAVCGLVRGENEGVYLRTLAEAAKQAARFDLPVIAHIYPLKFQRGVEVSFESEDVAWAVRCGMECGADVIKTPFCHDPEAFAQIVADCTVPVVAAGGPRSATFEEALAMFEQVVRSGGKGVTVGRNAWGFGNVTQSVRAIKAVVHDGRSAHEAMAMLDAEVKKP